MKQIWAICNTGLGSSFFVEMNIKDILQKYNLDGEYSAHHGALFDIDWGQVDYVVVASDLASCVPPLKPIIVLDSIIDIPALESRLLEAIQG